MSSIYIFIQYCPKQLGTTYSYGPTYLLRQEWNGERLGTYPYPTVMDSTSNEPLLAVVLFFFLWFRSNGHVFNNLPSPSCLLHLFFSRRKNYFNQAVFDLRIEAYQVS